MRASPPLQLAFFGDDFTGSTDALEQLAQAGLRTVLLHELTTTKSLTELGPLDAIGVAGATRSLSPDAMEAQLRPAFAAMRSFAPRHVHYKVCSTFDSSPDVGSIGRAIEVGAALFPGRFVPLVVGAPALGRYCAFGNLFARMGIGSAGAIHRLDRHPSMSRHPVTPADEADLRLHLARQTERRIGLVDFLHLDAGDEAIRSALNGELGQGAEIVLFDALTPAHLSRIGALLDDRAVAGAPLFSVGSSGVEMALTAHWLAQGTFVRRTDWPVPGVAEPLLVLSGSCSPVTARQIAWAEGQGFAAVALDVAAVARGESAPCREAAAVLAAALRAGRSTVLFTSRGETELELVSLSGAERGLIGRALGAIARDVLGQVPVRRLLVAGGDSSSFAAATLGIQALTMIAPLAPGAPLCRAHASGSPADGIEINFKGGQVGTDDYFGRVVRGR
jgi:uncharacterized protein YgbK (DUF1537 family)